MDANSILQRTFDRTHPHLLSEVILHEEFNYSLDELPFVEYGVDGFTSTGLTVIAGQAGLGKTSAIVPLAAEVAHLIRAEGDGFDIRPLIRRKVVYVTEDKDQVARILYGIKKHSSDLDDSEFREWLKIIPARRRSPEELAQDITRWRERFSYSADVDLNNYRIEPLIIIDTANANIDLDNENDNAEVGKAISAIKQALGGGMCWIVAHLAKSITKSEAVDLSIRGASAWGADANATGFLVGDDSLPGKRFLILAKRRFEPDYTEIEITSEVMTESVTTPWGHVQSQAYRVSRLLGLAKGNGMKKQASVAKALRYESDITQVLEDAYADCADRSTWCGLTTNQILERVSGKSDSVRDALKQLANTGKIESRKAGDHAKAAVHYFLRGQM